MACTVAIPNRTHENFGDSLAKLIRVINKIINCKEEEIILDFSQAKMLNPFFIGGLVCVINNIHKAGRKFTLNHNSNIHISSYLDTIKFPFAFSPAAGREDDFLRSLERYNRKTYIPIISFNTGSSQSVTIIRENVLSAVSQLLKYQLKFSEKETMPLHYFLSELTDNINEHSKAAEGFLFAQYYPNSNYLDLCICDAGIGIWQSYLNNRNYNPKTEADAIQLALSGRSTKDRAEARGFGITTTRNMLVKGLRGKLFLWSGQTTFLQTVNNEAIVNIEGNGFFKGTFIALRLPTVIPGNFDFYKFIDQ